MYVHDQGLVLQFRYGERGWVGSCLQRGVQFSKAVVIGATIRYDGQIGLQFSLLCINS